MINANLKLINKLLNGANFDTKLANQYLLNQDIDLINKKQIVKKK